jgi:ketosteroid isomerase-like protein
MPDLAAQVAALTRRVQALEDELAIHRHLTRYGFAVDTGDADATAALFAEDSVSDVDQGWLVMHGREGVRDMIRGARHQAMLPNCAHQQGPLMVAVDGDRAVATGYSRVYLRRDADIGIHRVSFNRWALARRGGGWEIVRRETRLLGHPDAGELLRGAAGR